MITEKTKDVETIVKGMKQLKIELDEFMFPVVVPSYPPPLADLDQGPIPSPSEQSRLEALMYNVDALTGLNDKEKEMVRFRLAPKSCKR